MPWGSFGRLALNINNQVSIAKAGAIPPLVALLHNYSAEVNDAFSAEASAAEVLRMLSYS